jgi:hypothetical protein
VGKDNEKGEKQREGNQKKESEKGYRIYRYGYSEEGQRKKRKTERKIKQKKGRENDKEISEVQR